MQQLEDICILRFASHRQHQWRHAARISRFERGTVPSTELHLPYSGDRPSYTRLRAPGCYAYQVDGPNFSYPVAFRAELLN